MFHPSDFALGVLSLQYAKHRPSQSFGRMSSAFKSVLLLTLAHAGLAFPAFATCTAPKNAIEAENCLPGNPPSQWYVQGAGSPNIQGFATDISVNVGQTIFFKISTNAVLWRIDIYRLGYYQGNGARLVTSVSPPRAPAPKPTSLSHRQLHRVNRLRQLGRVRLLGGAQHGHLRNLFCQARPAGHRGGESRNFCRT